MAMTEQRNQQGRSGSPVNTLIATITNKHTLQVENDIEKYIKAEAFLEQFRIKDFFEDYDKLRKGYVTEDKVGRPSLVPYGLGAAKAPSLGRPDSSPDHKIPHPQFRSH